jgi:TRAP transporter TAXI family solute receptor
MYYCKKQLKVIFFIGLILLLIPAMVLSANTEDKKIVRIASSSLGSTAYIHFEAVSFLVNKYSDKLKVSSIATAGSSENIVLLDEGKVDIGSASSMDLHEAWAGERWNKEIPIWQISSYTYWALPLITLADSGIETINDLIGKQVSIAAVGSGTEYMWRMILNEYGIYNDLRLNNLGWAAGFEALADGLILAAPGNYPGGKPHPEIIRLATRKAYKVLDIDQEILNRVRKLNPGILSVTLPKDAYEGLKEDVPSVGLYGLVMSTADVDDDTIYEFCKIIFGHTEELLEISSVSSEATLENAVKGLVPEYPVHPGAAKFFKEKGVWDDSLRIGKR